MLNPKNENDYSAKSKLHIFKALTIHFSILSLLVFPTIGFSGEDQNNWGQVGLKVLNQIGNTVIKQKRNSLSSLRMSGMMARYQPELIPAKFFPQCPVSKAISDFPDNMCRSNISPGDFQGMEMTRSFKLIATQQESFYENLLSIGQNSPRPVGLACLENAKAKALTDFQDRFNSLTALNTKLKKETDILKEQNKKFKKQMDRISDDLYGANKRDVKANTKKMSDYFSKSCADVFANASGDILKAKNALMSQGVIGLQRSIENWNSEAISTQSNRSTQEKDLRDQVNAIKSEIAEKGAEVWSSNPTFDKGRASTAFNLKAAGGSLATEAKNFAEEVSRIREIVRNEVGYTIPPIDHNFRNNTAEFTRNSKRYFEKQYINDCVTMADSGIGLDKSEILRSLAHSSSTSGNTVARYRGALESILNTDSFIEDKLQQIAELDRRAGVGTITITYNDSSARRVRETPYELFRKTVEACRQRMGQDDTFATNSSNQSVNRSSYKSKIERAGRYIKKIQALEKAFSAKVADSIFEEVSNCSGRPLAAGSCNGTTMTSSSPNFCISHAQKCASKVRSCFGEADTIVKAKTARLKTAAATFNRNVTQVIANQEIMLTKIKQQTIKDAEFIKRFLPNSDYLWPKDLSVKMPTKEITAPYGVELRGDIEMTSLDELPKKIESLQKMLFAQKGKVEKAISKYISGQREAMSINKEKWASLKDSCYDVEKTSIAAANKANADRMKAFGKSKSKAGQFCTKYGMLRDNPAGFCDKDGFSPADLAGEMSEIAQALDSSVPNSIGELAEICASYNNEKKDEEHDDSDDGDGKVSSLAKMCKDNGNDFAKVKKKLVADIISSLPEDFYSRKSKIKTWLTDSGDKSNIDSILSDDLKDDPYSETLQELKSKILNVKSVSKKDLLASLDSITESKCKTEDDSGKCTERKPSSFSSKADNMINKLKTKTLDGEGDLDACLALNVEQQLTGIEACKGSSKCSPTQNYNDEYAYGDDSISNSRKIASVVETLAEGKALHIGENTSGACIAEAGNFRSGGKGDSILSLDREILGDNYDLIMGK